MNKPIALQFHRRFFARTETFIYNYITHLKNFYPLCYSWRHINLKDFPLEDGHIFKSQSYHSALDRFINKVTQKIIGLNFLPCRLLDGIPIKLFHAHFGPQGDRKSV